ncbi:MAG: 3'(2'),5'-bisphosphate nucleotidase [Phycisphaerae bacterium]|nr:3'(2'),5'-bisphosphate nucleotidase [Phycisphaerae bacterium]
MNYENERQVAIEAVRKACMLCSRVRATLVSEETIAKRDKSPVTVADFGAQAVVISALLAAFPDAPVVGEEDAADLRAPGGREIREKVVRHVRLIEPGMSEDEILSAIDHGKYAGGPRGRHWTLDPIDGTKGFLRGEQYAVALALIEDGQVVLGVLGCPNLPVDPADPAGPQGCLFVAGRGTGTQMQALGTPDIRPVRVTSVADPVDASFCESVESGHSAHDDAARIAQLLGVTAPPCRMDSQCKYAAVARGQASIYLRLPTRADYQEKIWDHAAGCIIVQEAGGQVSDIHGRPLDFSLGRTLRDNKGVIATNRLLHDTVIGAAQKVSGTFLA